MRVKEAIEKILLSSQEALAASHEKIKLNDGKGDEEWLPDHIKQSNKVCWMPVCVHPLADLNNLKCSSDVICC